MLYENLHIQLEVVKSLILATLLLVDSVPLEYDYLEVMDEVFSIWPGLTDQLISQPDAEYFTDGSNSVWDGKCFARYAVMTLDTIIEAHLLPVGTSAQKAGLIALT
jgi:hypothetical protein